MILSSFDEFQVYNFNTRMDTPVDIVLVADLPERYGSNVNYYRPPCQLSLRLEVVHQPRVMYC